MESAPDRRYERLRDALVEIRDAYPTGVSYGSMNDGTWREACRDFQRIARLALKSAGEEV